MPISVYCMSANDVDALEIADSVITHGIPCSEVSLVWRQTPKGLEAKPGKISGPGGAWSMHAGALAKWPGLLSVNVRDLGRVIAAGRLLDAFDGAATGQLMQLAPALTWAGIPAYESRYYAGMVYTGGILVMVQVKDQIEAAQVERGWTECSAREISFRFEDESTPPASE